jgi:hypothetical protein
MSSLSYSDVFQLSLDSPDTQEVAVGDVVRTGRSQHPRFTVVALSGDTAWLRNVDTGANSLAPRTRCRLAASGGLAMAAE